VGQLLGEELAWVHNFVEVDNEHFVGDNVQWFVEANIVVGTAGYRNNTDYQHNIGL
jgi:hypothetical protein